MTQLPAFMNITQIRKLTQDTFKPIITQIESQITKIKKQSQFLKGQSQKTLIIQQKQTKFQQTLKINQQDIHFIKIRLQQLKDQDLKNLLQSKKQFTFLNQEIQALKKSKLKYEQMINKQKKQNDRILANFNKYQTWMDQKVINMNQDYLKLKKDTYQMTLNVKQNYQIVQLKYNQLEKNIKNKLLANDKKYQILQLYLKQRQQFTQKIIKIQQKFSQYAPKSQIQYLRSCQLKQLQMNKTQITNILETYLPPQIKQRLPSLTEKVKQIEKIKLQINDIKTNVFQSQQQMTQFKQSTQSLQSNFRKQFKEINQNLNVNIESLKNNVEKALAIDQKQNEQRKKFQQKFVTQIHKFVQKQNQKSFKKISEQTEIKLQQRKKQDSNMMQQQKALVQQKHRQIKQISQNIENLLASYNSRIVKVRSDGQLFKNQIMKELKSIQNIRHQNNDRFQNLGKVIASLTQIITMNLTIDMNQDKNSLKGDNFAFATFNDGIIYQSVPYNKKQGDKNTFKYMTYRRNQLEIPHLRRCILTSLVHLIDNIYESCPFLSWKGYKPSNFFKQQILQTYRHQVQKYGTNLKQENLNYSNSLDQTSNILKKNQNTSLILKKNPINFHSAQKSNFSNNQTIQIGKNNNLENRESFIKNYANQGQIIDQNIQIKVTKQKSKSNYLGSQTLQIYKIINNSTISRDFENRFVLSGFANRQAIKQASNTISHIPQSACSTRKRYLAKSKKQTSRYQHNQTQTFMTSRSSRRTSIANYKL